MPRGRPAVPKAPTKFLNSKKRVIYMTAEGKYLAKSDKGHAVYNPKAHHVKSPGGTVRTVTNSKARVPTAIRAKMMRAKRSDAGKKRPMRPGQMYAKPIGPRRPAGRPRRRLVSPGGNMGIAALFGGKPVRMMRKPFEGLRKERKNKGMKRGPRKPKNAFARLMAPLN